MKTLPTVIACLGIGTAAFLSGCSQVSSSAQTQMRINEKASAYNALTPVQQESILGGAIERGNTSDMVYMALGKPTRVVTSPDGKKAMWVYVEYYSPNGVTKTNFNPTNASTSGRYSSQMVSPNSPFNDAAANQRGFDAVAPQKFGGTTGGLLQALDLPDMAQNTVYVFFFSGKVVEIKLDGNSTGMPTAAANG